MGPVELTGRIERMRSLEDKHGVTFQALYAMFDPDDYFPLTVNFDAVATNGDLDNSVRLVVSVYNESGQLTNTDDYILIADDYSGFESVSIRMTDCKTPPAKIRIYPKWM